MAKNKIKVRQLPGYSRREDFSPVSPWLARTRPHLAFYDGSGQPHLEWGGFVGIDAWTPLHATIDLDAQSLASAWNRLRKYIASALGIISAAETLSLDKEEVGMIDAALGAPPEHCYPIYFITVQGAGIPERVVYVGKTSSNRNRFAGGHAAITKLHDPKYDGQEKRVYLATVILLDVDKESLPLEAVRPLADGARLLRSVEHDLIYCFQPELNTQGKTRNLATDRVSLQIQNSVSTCPPNTTI